MAKKKRKRLHAVDLLTPAFLRWPFMRFHKMPRRCKPLSNRLIINHSN